MRPMSLSDSSYVLMAGQTPAQARTIRRKASAPSSAVTIAKCSPRITPPNVPLTAISLIVSHDELHIGLGTSSCSRPMRLGSIWFVSNVNPVALPPGRLKLATKPAFTGSPPIPKTMGTAEVAFFAATAEGSGDVVRGPLLREEGRWRARPRVPESNPLQLIG